MRGPNGGHNDFEGSVRSYISSTDICRITVLVPNAQGRYADQYYYAPANYSETFSWGKKGRYEIQLKHQNQTMTCSVMQYAFSMSIISTVNYYTITFMPYTYLSRGLFSVLAADLNYINCQCIFCMLGGVCLVFGLRNYMHCEVLYNDCSIQYA